VSGNRRAVVAGGGTAGHVVPALAVANALVARGWAQGDVELVGSRRGQDAELAGAAGFGVTTLPGRGLVRSFSLPDLWANLGAVAGLVSATVQAVVLVARWRPAVVVSVGGYASFPAAAAAVVLRRPLVLVNVDAVPGLVHRVLGRFASASAVAFAGTPLPHAVVTGTPVRADIGSLVRSPAAAGEARRALGLPADRVTLATFGGSLGARRINEAVVDLAGRWRDRGDVSLFQVTGRRDHQWVTDRVAAAGAGALAHRVVDFCRQMPLLYQAADVVVCRAGAMTVAELAAAGVPAVLVPLPGAPSDHQRANAEALVAAGAAVMVPDDQCTGERLDEVVGSLLDDPTRRRAMALAARGLARPDAARRVADLVTVVADRRSAAAATGRVAARA